MIRCAFYEKEITPPLGFNLPGYFNFRPGDDVRDRLYSKAVVVDNGSVTAAIIAIDSCHAHSYLRDKVVERIEKYTGIKSENIVFSANHTHTGIPLYGSYDKEGLAEYLWVISALIADCVILAYKRLVECELTFGIGDVQGISFCRNYFMKNSTPRTNPGRLNPDIDKPAAGIDPELPVLFFKDKYGSPKGAVISFACHQDCVGGTELSGDFSSVLSQELKKIYGEDFVTVFMIGACGNINHFDVTRAEDAPDHYAVMGKIIASEAVKVIEKATLVAGDEIAVKFKVLKMSRVDIEPKILKNAEHAVETITPAVGVKIAADSTDPDQYRLAMANRLLDFINGSDKYDVPIQVLRIGNFLLYTFPGEIFYQFGEMVKEASPTSKYMVATMCNASIGYVPTRDMYYPTIYESMPGSNKLEKESGYIMADELIQIGKCILETKNGSFPK